MTPTAKTPPAIHLPRTAPLREFVTVSRLRSVFSEFSGGGLPETVDGIVGDEAMLDSRLNEDVAGRLEEIARLLAAQGANPFRARAYHRAAETVRRLPEPVSNILDKQGLEGLQALPGVGEGIARSLRDVLAHGRLAMLERLRGESDPISLLTSVPGIGRTLADRLHHDLGIDTLEDLEAAAHDGRLEQILGFGPKRLAGIRDSLAHRLARVRTPAESRPDSPLSVEELLDVDREYREKARAGRLVRIAPRRFNPSRAAWLPILHTERGPRHYTALFSNTARAHRLGRTGDWVVIYSDGAHGERQFTVITSEFGPLKGRRIVRGREAECDQASPAPHEAVDRAGQHIPHDSVSGRAPLR